MHPMPDLDPADLAARIALTDTLAGLRRRAGLTTRPYAALLGVSQGAVCAAERDPAPNPSVLSCIRRAAAAGHRFDVRIVGLPVVHGDPLEETLAARRPAGPDAWADVLAALLMRRLNLARAELGLTIDDLAERLRISAAGVKHQYGEANGGLRLLTAQRSARALGGWLEFPLTRLEVPHATHLVPTLTPDRA